MLQQQYAVQEALRNPPLKGEKELFLFFLLCFSLYGNSKLQGQVEFQEDVTVTVLCAVTLTLSDLTPFTTRRRFFWRFLFQVSAFHPAPRTEERRVTDKSSGVRNFGFWHKIGKMEQK